MADFSRFFSTLLKHQSGFVLDPADPGGATNRGITLKDFQMHARSLLGVDPTMDNLKQLTDAQAAKIYKVQHWDKVCGDSIEPQELANIVFDFQVDAGANATRLLQRVLNELGASPPLPTHGVMDANTLASLAKADAQAVYKAYKQGRKDYYMNLVQQRPVLGKSLKGWLARVDAFPDHVAAAVSG